MRARILLIRAHLYQIKKLGILRMNTTEKKVIKIKQILEDELKDLPYIFEKENVLANIIMHSEALLNNLRKRKYSIEKK